jgi:hypothetical protein
MAENSPGANLVLPSSSGTIALTSDIPTDVNNITSATTSDGTCDLLVASLSVYPNGGLSLVSSNSGGVVVLNGQQATDARIIAFPDASGTVALTSQTVLKSDYTPAHSILAQQSGTGSPTAVTLGNNTILGRMSGGGSNIAGLSASDARTVMGLGTLATVNGGTGVATALAVNVGSAGAFVVNGGTATNMTLAGTLTINSTTYTYGAGAGAAHLRALQALTVMPEQARIHAAHNTYNGSNQTTNRFWRNLTAYTVTPSVTPSSAATKGTLGEVLSAGTGFTWNNVNGAGNAPLSTPLTVLFVFRPTAESAAAKFRHRNWDVFFESTNQLRLRALTAGNVTNNLVTRTITTSDFVCVGFSGDLNNQRAAVFHNGQVQTGSVALQLATGIAEFDAQIGAGAAGSGGGIEWVAAIVLTGMVDVERLGTLCQEFYNRNVP